MDNDIDKLPLLTEVPEMLKKLTLILAKTFYGFEQFVLADYIQRKVIVKEDAIRELLKVDQKYLRQLLIQLKVDKFIKERLVAEEADGRSKKVNYYFINYKAILNVTKYKLDHMRQKLEIRDKDEVLRTAYRCTNESCKKQYEDMDIGKIYNLDTDEMRENISRCWQCGHLVETDDSAGPSTETRNSLAKFNEEMAGLFSMLQNLNGVRFSQEIIEPPIPTAEPVVEAQPEQRVTRVGERAFSTTGKTRTELYSSGITVSIGGEAGPLPEAKEAVPWLQDRQERTDSAHSMLFNDVKLVPDLPTTFDSMLGSSTSLSATKSAPNLASLESHPTVESPVMKKRPKREDIATLLLEEEGHSMDAPSTADFAKTSSSQPMDSIPVEKAESVNDADDTENNVEDNRKDGDEDNSYVTVQGNPVHIDNVTHEIVSQMTPNEKEAYVQAMQQNHYYF